MLRVLYGRAGTGKTSALFSEIAKAAASGQGGRVLIVPEQYSHECERELCRVCGDRASLYAEVLSFTGLARKVADEVGGSPLPVLDKGGRLLCMARAMSQIAPRLRVFRDGARRAQLQLSLLTAVDELKTACVTPEALSETADVCGGYLGDKLQDLALILSTYDAIAAAGHTDPSDALTRLAEHIGDSSLTSASVYLDGFTDFTRQEHRVLEALLTAGADVTLCLTMDDPYQGSEIFDAQRRTARMLVQAAEACGVKAAVEAMTEHERGRAEPLKVLDKELFSYTAEHCEDPEGCVSVYQADTISGECELAAARACALAQSGARWRDIAIAVRGFGDYRGSLERAFRQYGVPLYCAQRTDLLQKPLGALIASAYEVVNGGWDGEDVIACLRTGLTPLTAGEIDTLENYTLLWQVRGNLWRRAEPWTQHPDGYNMDRTEDSDARLEEIDRLRRIAAKPLMILNARAREAETADAQAMALADYFDALGLAERLDSLAQELRETGREALAAEYEQLWNLIVSALEQFAALLAGVEMDAEEFARLLLLMLSRYDIGTIPVALDRVTAGELDRMRRREIRHLILLGASDDRIPRAQDSGGVLSQDERRRLLEYDLDVGGGREEELWREYALAASCLSLPDTTLTVSYTAVGQNGEPLRPAFPIQRIERLFGTKPRRVDLNDCKTRAQSTAAELAAAALRGAGGMAAAAREWMRRSQPEMLDSLAQKAAQLRGSLSPQRVRELYGATPRFTASRADKFSSCRYAYFLQYGLKAKPRRSAAFSPPEVGTFYHYVLQHVAEECASRGGFAALTDETIGSVTDKWVQTYVHEQLNDYADQTDRFVYLFRRLCRSVRQIVLDMAEELRHSDFEPLDFELNFADPDALPPLTLSDGEATVTMSGIADRVDGWLHDGRLYLRVVDYKTGKKSFSLSDVWYGMGLQMLLYLFTLQSVGAERYGHEIVPAGVLYVPARDVLVSADADLPDELLRKKRGAQLRRSGLVLDGTLQAMERDGDAYIKLRTNRGEGAGVTLATAEQLGQLSRHVQETLLDMSRELRSGSIACDPYFRTQQDTACTNCDFYDICHFAPGSGTDRHRVMKKLTTDTVWALLKGGEEDG